MSELCTQCVHRRFADTDTLNAVLATGLSPAEQRAVNQLGSELRAARRLEEIAFKREAGGGVLRRRPLEHDWCFARSQADSGVYYFCDWLTTMECPDFQPLDGSTPVGASAAAASTVTASPALVAAVPSVPTEAPAPPVTPRPAPAAPAPVAPTPAGAPTAATSATPAEEWSLPHGSAFE
jgi:hypothetical protein